VLNRDKRRHFGKHLRRWLGKKDGICGSTASKLRIQRGRRKKGGEAKQNATREMEDKRKTFYYASKKVAKSAEKYLGCKGLKEEENMWQRYRFTFERLMKHLGDVENEPVEKTRSGPRSPMA